MNQRNIEDKLLDVLVHMIQDHDRHFEKETAQYILSRLSTDFLLKPRRIHGIKNFVVSSGIFGHVLLKNIYDISKKNYTAINEWKELLVEKDPVLINNPDIIFAPQRNKEQTPNIKGNVEITSNFITYYAIKNFQDWADKPNQEFFGYTNNDVDPILLTLECLCEEQDSYYHVGYKENGESKTTDKSENILEFLIKGKSEIIKRKWHDDKSFTNKVFASKRIKSIMKDVSAESLESLFSEESLGTIIRNANNYSTLADSKELLSNLLALAPAEKWLEGFRKVTQKKHIDIIELLNNKFNYGYGINLHLEYKSGLRKEGNDHPKVATLLKDELKFFFPALSKMEFDKNQLCLLVNGILRTRDVELMSIFLDSFDIPKVNADESAESHKIYNKMMFNMDDKINLDYVENGENIKIDNWHQAIATIQAKKLEKDLSINEEPVVKRKLKI